MHLGGVTTHLPFNLLAVSFVSKLLPECQKQHIRSDSVDSGRRTKKDWHRFLVAYEWMAQFQLSTDDNYLPESCHLLESVEAAWPL